MPIFHKQTEVGDRLTAELSGQRTEGRPQATQTLFVFNIRDSIALRFEPFKRMYENGSKIALNSTCSTGFNKKIKEAYLSLRLCYFEVFVAAESF